MMQKFSKRTLRALVVTNTLALLLSGPMAAIGPAMAQQSPYPPPPPYPSYPPPQAQPRYTPAPVPSSAPPAAAQQQPGAAPSAAIPSDMAGFEQPWPREVNAQGLKMMVYQPQVEEWNGNRLDLKAAVGINVDAPNAHERHFGAIWITARTDVDKDRRAVWLADVQVTRANFPTAPQYAQTVDQALDGQAGIVARVISLDQLQTSLTIAQQQRGKEQAIEVANDPPTILFDTGPAVLAIMDGEPVLRSAAPNLERVVNTNVLLLKEASSGRYFLRVAGYWATAPGLQGPWSIAYQVSPVLDQVKQQALAQGGVDILDDDDKPSPYGVLPDIYISGVPAELLLTDGEPQFVPIDGTRLLYVQNSASDIFVDTSSQDYYVLISGRWFRARNIEGPWAYVDSTQLPQDFRRIPEQHAKGSVLVSIAGTPQAEEAVIANSIPQTATIDRQQARFVPAYDGRPQLAPIEGTPMQYVANAPVPVIMVDPHTFYAVENGVWFTAPAPDGPWIVAPSVPPVIYTIPPASPVYYATYVRVYSATPRHVYVGYTPGYYGTYVTPRRTVVYGSGYRYRPWVGETYYARPATYGSGAGFAAGTFTGFALGLATAAIVSNQFWGPHWDGRRDYRRDWRDRNVASRPDSGRTGDPRSTTTIRQTSSVTTVNNYSSNVYNTWNNQAVVRTTNVQPAVAPVTLRERQRQVDALRADSQASRERAAQTRQAAPGVATPGVSTPGAAPGTAAPVAATRNDVFVGADGNPYRQGARGPERLDDRRNREAFDPNRRGGQDRRTAQPAPAAQPAAPAAAPAVTAPAAPVPVATPAPRDDDNQRRRGQQDRRTAQPAPAVQPAAPSAAPAATAPAAPAPVATPAPRDDDNQRRGGRQDRRTAQPAPAVQPAAPGAAPAATAPAAPAPVAIPTPRTDDNQRRAAENQRRQQEDQAKRAADEKARQDQAAKAAADRQRADQERAAKAAADSQRAQQDQARRMNEDKARQDQAAKAAADRQRADQERAAKAAADSQRVQQDQARRAAEAKSRQDQAAKAAADRQRADQERAARAQSDQRRQQENAARAQAEQQKRAQENAAKAQAEQLRRQQQAAPPAQQQQVRPQPAPQQPQPQAQPQGDRRQQQGGGGGGKGRDKKSDEQQTQ